MLLRIRVIWVVFLLFNGIILFGQTTDSLASNNKSVSVEYFSRTDLSSYSNLILYENGEFKFLYKFEAMGVFETNGIWRATKKGYSLHKVNHINGRKPVNFVTKWFVFDDKICSNKCVSKNDIICLERKEP